MVATDPSAFGVLLRKYRADARLTQEELAERAGISARVVSDLERGVTQTPQRHTIQSLVDALDLSGDHRILFRKSARSGRRSISGHLPRSRHMSLELRGNLPVQPTPFT